MKLPITRDIAIRYLPYVGLEKIRPNGKNWLAVCPYCKRLGKKEKERKFYILTSKGVNVYCHKCGTSKSFTSFLEDFSPSTLESIKSEVLLGKRIFVEAKKEAPVEEPVAPRKDIAGQLQPLRRSKIGMQYAEMRMLPDWFIDELFYTDNYMEFLFNNHLLGAKMDKPDPRIVIPYIDENGEWTHIQGRSINPNEKLRYLTTTLKEGEPKIWGLHRVDESKPVYITEGAFDAVYLKNAIAFGSAYCDLKILQQKKIDSSKVVFCFDRDLATNDNLKAAASKYIEYGARLFFFPVSVKHGVKDFNDLIKLGWTEDQVQEFVDKNTFSGLAAKAKLVMLGGVHVG